MPLKVTVEEKGQGAYAIRPEGSIDANTFSILGLEVEEIMKKSPRMIIFVCQCELCKHAGVACVTRRSKI